MVMMWHDASMLASSSSINTQKRYPLELSLQQDVALTGWEDIQPTTVDFSDAYATWFWMFATGRDGGHSPL